MEQITIRKVEIVDLEDLRDIAIQTFREAFASENKEEDINHYIENNLSPGQLRSELVSNESIFFFAETQKGVSGYLKINWGKSQTEIGAKEGLEIERIYVLKEFQGEGLGRKLFEKALSVAKSMSKEYIWLGVWEHNSKAIQFYERNGFKPFGTHVFTLGEDDQVDIMMRLDMKGMV